MKAISISAVLLPLLLTTLLSGCATTSTGDPLKNTKKLVVEGHASLYNNGAFQVPNTRLSLIPPGPTALELAGELAGIRARQTYLTALDRASDSVIVVAEGTKMTWQLTGQLREGTDKLTDQIRSRSRDGSKLLLSRSTALGYDIAGKSWQFSWETLADRERIGQAVTDSFLKAADTLDKGGSSQGDALAKGALTSSTAMSDASIARSKGALTYGKNAFVTGYAAIPARMKQRGQTLSSNIAELNLVQKIKGDNSWREEWSSSCLDLIGNTTANYGSNIASSFRKAGDELSGEQRDSSGLSLAALKSLRWVLKGLLWDAVVEPTARVSTAAVGYVGVNAVAYPAVVLVKEGVAVTNLALEVSWDSASSCYDIVAPSATAALAGVYSLADFTGSHVAAGGVAAAGSATGYGEAALAKAASVTIKGSGYAAGKGAQYLGIPLAAAGVTVGGGTVGAAVGTGGALSAGTLLVTGETGALTGAAFGNILAGTTLVGGTAASAATGTTLGVYELSKAVVVPPGYALGGGMVLSYGTMSHLGAHSILAVSDASYMVLSLEGPRWVLYAVSGKLGKGENLPTGALLDLKQMQASGEEIRYLPVSDEEMKAVVESVYDNLPVKD
ncbi:MAG: hypothetical protein FIA91_06800 [Geobacter sp.]|nr:hypothetical protein [Geobacter sp.]